MKIIDLSFNVEPNLSEPMSIKIKTRPHSGGSKFGRKIIFMGKRSLKDKAMAVIHYMSGKERITKKSFPDQEFINEQRISLSVHTGTHLDAPSHFGTRCEGKKPKTIDEIPLEWCYGNGVVLNFCNKGPCEEISVEDVKKELERIEYYIQENDIVLIRTDTDKKWGNLYREGWQCVSPYQSISWFYTAPQGQISIFYKLKGYSKTFVADRISSDVALGYAYQSIMLNRLDTCLVCGTEAGVFPYGMSLFSSSDVLSKKRDACYCPYDLKRNGMILGEGAGTLVIEELEHALKRNAPIYGEILSFSNNCDGVHHKEKNKNGKKYKEVIESCIRKANISYDEIDYINLDGAALWEDDVIETNVLKEIWGKEIGTVFLSCPKSMFGNTFGAAGALDAIINCLAIKNNTVPPTINYEDQDSNCDLNYTPNKALHRNINTVLQIARGRGGINSAMLLREFKE